MLPLLTGIAVVTLSFALFGCWCFQRRGAWPDGVSAPGPSAVEMRRLARCTKNSVRVFSQVGTEERLQEGWIIDRSSEGVGLILVICDMARPSDEPARGTVLEVKPTNAPGDCPWVRVEVRHVRREAGYWHVGGKLLNAIDAENLPYFGHEPPKEDAASTATKWDELTWTGGAYPLTGAAHVAEGQPDRENAVLAR